MERNFRNQFLWSFAGIRSLLPYSEQPGSGTFVKRCIGKCFSFPIVNVGRNHSARLGIYIKTKKRSEKTYMRKKQFCQASRSKETKIERKHCHRFRNSYISTGRSHSLKAFPIFPGFLSCFLVGFVLGFNFRHFPLVLRRLYRDVRSVRFTSASCFRLGRRKCADKKNGRGSVSLIWFFYAVIVISDKNVGHKKKECGVPPPGGRKESQKKKNVCKETLTCMPHFKGRIS